MNRLAQEKSPYLLQHKNNPVDWFPWGDEALTAAREQDKPIFLSIGYSTCYWCHVMERESFEDVEVAAALNKDFIAIKLDREERPDIDKVYMDAVMALSGQGGWPLSAFLTPELKPFFAGTYFKKDQFLNLLAKVVDSWHNDRDRIMQSADGLTDAVQVSARSTASHELSDGIFQLASEQLVQRFDSHYGGFGDAPKFPPTGAILFLLREHARSGNADALQMATATLDRMARGGIYDQLGGGFHRYAVDRHWGIPHFEKMLYDNALLIRCYLEAFQVTAEPMYADVGKETLEYVLREMTSDEGAFFAAQDAGEVGKEGEYFVWNADELSDLLSEEQYSAFCKMYGVQPAGNFENGFTVLQLQDGFSWSDKNEEPVKAAHETLFAVREERRKPHLDDKVLTAWNALMISALCKGFGVLEDTRYLAAAQKCGLFLKQRLYGTTGLLRRYRDGEAKYAAYLDDYSFLIQALIDLYEADFNPEWLQWAETLQKELDTSFWDHTDGAYFYSREGDPTVLVRKKEIVDGALPSGNAVALHSLHRLFHLTYQDSYTDQASRLSSALSGFLVQYPSALCYSLLALDFAWSSPAEVAVVGALDSEFAAGVLRHLRRSFLPHQVVAAAPAESEYPKLLMGKQAETEAACFVCRDKTCHPAALELDAVISLLQAT